MSQTLSGYLTQVQRLLHDSGNDFYTTPQLTSYIEEARQRVVRDTGCLRTIQITQVPCNPESGTSGKKPFFWSAGATVAYGDFVVSNIFIYKVIIAGVLGSQAPPYPTGNGNLPPDTAFTNGTATLFYAGNSEIIKWSCLPEGLKTLDVININLYWGNSRVPQRYLPWTQFNAELRFWQNYIGRPIAFSMYGQGQIYISPVPDQVYTVEIDTIILPSALATEGYDVIQDPYTSPVQFYAAYLAKYYEQSFGEAEIFKQEYIKSVQSVLVSSYTRRMPNPYSTPY
jgi:hypothetical protein